MTVLRPARSDDAAAIARLLDALGYGATDGFLARRIVQQCSHPDAALVVAEEKGRVVGVMSLHVIPQLALTGDFCRISYLCVDEGARGRGIGKLLADHAEACARERGCDRIELHSHERRSGAHAFYARLGYEESPKYFIRRLVR